MPIILALLLATLTVAITETASASSEQGNKQAVLLEIYSYNITEFSAIKTNFTDAVLDEVVKVCEENIEKCKPVTSTTRADYDLTVVTGYPRFSSGITDRFLVAFYVQTKNGNVIPVSTLYSIVSESKANILKAIGHKVGEAGHLYLPTKTLPPTGASSYDIKLLTILGGFVGVIGLAILIVVVVCCVGYRANREPKLRDFTNEAVDEDEDAGPPTTPHDAWSKRAKK